MSSKWTKWSRYRIVPGYGHTGVFQAINFFLITDKFKAWAEWCTKFYYLYFPHLGERKKLSMFVFSWTKLMSAGGRTYIFQCRFGPTRAQHGSHSFWIVSGRQFFCVKISDSIHLSNRIVRNLSLWIAQIFLIYRFFI